MYSGLTWSWDEQLADHASPSTSFHLPARSGSWRSPQPHSLAPPKRNRRRSSQPHWWRLCSSWSSPWRRSWFSVMCLRMTKPVTSWNSSADAVIVSESASVSPRLKTLVCWDLPDVSTVRPMPASVCLSQTLPTLSLCGWGLYLFFPQHRMWGTGSVWRCNSDHFFFIHHQNYSV